MAEMEFYRDLNHFYIYNDNYTELKSPYEYRYALPFERIHDAKSITMFLQRNWMHSFTISIVYYVGIRILEWYLRDKKPLSLQRPLFYWNAGLALFSIIGLLRFAEEITDSLTSQGLYKAICETCNPHDVAAFWSLMFAISKVVELGDTLFIVLRKKPLIFLHYYHHAAVLIYTVHSGAEHAAPGRAFIAMNYLAHSFMYTYYAITAAGYKQPRWVSMSVTTIQTTQMLMGVFISLFVYRVKTVYNWPCQQSLPNLYLAFLIYITFAVLFINFFYKTYIASKSKREERGALRKKKE